MFPTLLLLLLTISLFTVYFFKSSKSSVDFRILLLNLILVSNYFLMFAAKTFELNQDFALGLIFSFFNGALLMFLLQGKNNYLFLHFYLALILLISYVVVYSTAYADSVDFMRKVNNVALIVTAILNLIYASVGFVVLSSSKLVGYPRCITVFYIVSQFIGSFLGVSFLFNVQAQLGNMTIYTLHVALVLIVSTIFFTYIKIVEFRSLNTKSESIAIDPKIKWVDVETPLVNKKLEIVEIEHQVALQTDNSSQNIVNDFVIKQLIWDKVIEPKLYLKHDLTLLKLANILKLDKGSLKDFFTQTEAKTFTHYINRFRIEYAVGLMRCEKQENLSIEKVAEMCGFNSRTSFYRAFVNVMGFPPSELLDN